MNKRDSISMSVIRRMPRYYRFLGDLKKNGITRISSRELSARMGLTASQIRQDLNCFGDFGQQGYGYMVEQLHEEIGKILGVDLKRKTIMIGAGNLGRAVAAHMSFNTKGFELIGIFDKNPLVIGKAVNGIIIHDSCELEEFCNKEKPIAAILCIPREATKDIAESLISYGIKAFWNFSHYDLAISHPEVTVENVHLSDSLMTLSYRIGR